MGDLVTNCPSCKHSALLARTPQPRLIPAPLGPLVTYAAARQRWPMGSRGAGRPRQGCDQRRPNSKNRGKAA